MFIKPFPKYNSTTGERYTIYRLCESYRIDGYIRHHTIIGFGKLEELPTDGQKKQLGKRVEEMLKHGTNKLLLEEQDEKIEKLALYFYNEIKRKQRYDTGAETKELETVDLSTLKNRDGQDVGAEWLCKQAFDQLGIEEGIKSINEGANKKGGTKKLDKVHQGIGRLKQEYPSAQKYYDISVHDDGNGRATSVSCKHKTGADPEKKAGIYFLRTSLDETDEKIPGQFIIQSGK